MNKEYQHVNATNLYGLLLINATSNTSRVLLEKLENK